MGAYSAVAARHLAYGGSYYGLDPWTAFAPSTITVPVEVVGLAGFAFNDRYQVVVVSDAGVGGVAVPELRYWSVQPPDWSSVLPTVARDRLIPFYALDEDGDAVMADVEFPYVVAPKGQELTVAGVVVEFVCRPFTIGDFDGGLDELEPIGFDVTVHGYGQPGNTHMTGSPPLKTGVVSSAVQEFRMMANEIAVEDWPNDMAFWAYCRLDTHVRGARISISNIKHCQIEAAELYGDTHPSRFT